jgi:O-antigen ligase
VWERSPVIGRGLSTGTRFEVLAPAGFTRTSTIHSTWVEALVGTGAVGVGLLFLAFLLVLLRSLGEALRRKGRIVPVLLVAVLTVQSITGPTIELFSMNALLFLTIALTLDRRPAAQEEQAEIRDPTRSGLAVARGHAL